MPDRRDPDRILHEMVEMESGAAGAERVAAMPRLPA
jgi:hypothetical protein